MTVGAHANLVAVDYLHQYINKRWNIDVPKGGKNNNIVSIRYLMGRIDAANEMLNGRKTSDYANDAKYASRALASATFTDDAVDNLIRLERPTCSDTDCPFQFKPAANNGNKYAFAIGAAGNFTVDWGDGEIQEIQKDMGMQTISHEYADNASNYTIKLGGHATGYPSYDMMDDESDVPAIAIAFGDLDTGQITELSSIDGCLGCVFSTLDSGAQPLFVSTFTMQTQLKTVPAGLFDGIHGAGTPGMFGYTFLGSGLESLPDNMFGGLTSAALYTFFATFSECPQLKTVGGNWFADLESLDDTQALYGLFAGSGIETIGDNWFAKLTRLPPVKYDGETKVTEIAPFLAMFAESNTIRAVGGGWFASLTTIESDVAFAGMFSNQPYLQSIGDDWFPKLTTVTGAHAFAGMFESTASLRQIPPMFKNIKTGAPYMFDALFRYSGLTSIPDGMFANLETGAEGMFRQTFMNTNITSIPANLFGDIQGDYPDGMFLATFFGLLNLTGDTARVGPADNRQFLWERWPDVNQPQQTYGYTSLNYPRDLDEDHQIALTWWGSSI